MVKLDILSDPICPWCYLGKANLEVALARTPDHPFVIEWHPFQLNPDMPREGADRASYMAVRFPDPSQLKAAHERLAKMGEDVGIVYDFAAQKRIPSTLDAHRLIHWASIESKQSPVVTALFKAYFVDGRDIGHAEVLADIADAEGMDAALVARLLASDADLQDIRDRDAHSRKMGISAVPTYIVAQQHAVPGAQPPEMWDRVIADLKAQMADGTAA